MPSPAQPRRGDTLVSRTPSTPALRGGPHRGHMPQSYSRLHYHIVFGTKDRRRLITPSIQPRLYRYISGVLRAQGGLLLNAGGTPDHVHLLVELSRDSSVSLILRDIKANSSKWIHATFPELRDFAWQRGYDVFAVSYLQKSKMSAHISKLTRHHNEMTYEEEFVALLRRYETEYDDRYLFE